MRTIDHAWQILRNKESHNQLAFSIRLLIEEYYEVLENDAGNLPRLESLAKEILDISEGVNEPLALVIMNVELAVIRARQGMFGQAYRKMQKVIKLLEESRPSDEGSNQIYAAAYWLLGCLEIHRGNPRSEILKSWQTSLNLHEKLASHPLMNHTGEYRYRIRRMQEEIKTFISDQQYVPKFDDRPKTVPSKPEVTVDRPINQPNPPTINFIEPITLFSNQTEYLEVYNTIPAGPLLELEDGPLPLDTLHLEKEQKVFEIERQDYELFSLDEKQQTLRLNTEQRYAILKVQGDSMNLANIDSGDYVLLRLQNSAEHKDIVAAQLTLDGAAPQATLKRFERHGRQIQLRAQSSNPKNKSYTIDEKDMQQQVSIIGTALGIFKPNNSWTTTV